MDGIIVFGCTQFAKMVADYIEWERKYKVLGYTVNREYIPDGGMYFGKQVIPYEEIQQIYPPKKCMLVLAVAYQGMNHLREKIYYDAKNKGYTIYTYIHPTVSLMAEEIGEGSIILEEVKLGYKCKLGKCNILFTGSCINHESVIGDFNYFAPECVLAGNVKVGKNCFFGCNSTIRNNIEVLDYTLVGAGVYINQNTREKGVYVPEKAVCIQRDSLDMII